MTCKSIVSFQCRKIYYVNKDRRCVNEGRENGQTNVMLNYEDEETLPPIKVNCCIQFFNCLKGSAAYRDMRQRISKNFDGLNSVSTIDQISRCLFPLAFFIFHTVYWVSYLDGSDDIYSR